MAASIVGILAGLAIPNLRTTIYRARATEVAADMEVVRVAVPVYNAQEFGWPAESALWVSCRPASVRTCPKASS